MSESFVKLSRVQIALSSNIQVDMKQYLAEKTKSVSRIPIYNINRVWQYGKLENLEKENPSWILLYLNQQIS